MLDFLVITAHPDDEMAVAGLLLKAKKAKYITGLICLTKGESGGFATKEERVAEINAAAKVLGLEYLRILDFPDAGVEATSEGVQTLIPLLRECEARTILTIHPEDYHPDHRAVSALVDRATFVAGLNKYGSDGKTWHPSQVLHFSLDPKRNLRRPDIVMDISDVKQQWLKAIACYPSQEIQPMLEGWASYTGSLGGFPLAEGLYHQMPLRLQDIESLLNTSKGGR